MIKKILVVLAFILIPSIVLGAMVKQPAHEKYIYPVVRVTELSGGGSGTIVYSTKNELEKYSTYILTNHHVVASAIRVEDVWDPDIGKNVKKERRAIMYVEVFKYKDMSEPVGAMKVEAEIIIYNTARDVALLKLKYDGIIEYIATMPEKNIKYYMMDETVAVGCSLLYPPLPTVGVITRMNVLIDSIPFHMSSSQVVFGSSGGAMFLSSGEFIGIPARVAVAQVGWGVQIMTHMGLFIPVESIYKWLEDEHYEFIFDKTKTEKQCLSEREEALKKKKDKETIK